MRVLVVASVLTVVGAGGRGVGPAMEAGARFGWRGGWLGVGARANPATSTANNRSGRAIIKPRRAQTGTRSGTLRGRALIPAWSR